MDSIPPVLPFGERYYRTGDATHACGKERSGTRREPVHAADRRRPAAAQAIFTWMSKYYDASTGDFHMYE